MATTPLPVGARPAKLDATGTTSNVLPFQRPIDPLAYSPGVPPFDRSNPAHVRAWNSMYAFGLAEQKRIKEGR